MLRELLLLMVLVTSMLSIANGQSFHPIDENGLLFWSPELQGVSHRKNGGAFLSLYGNGKLLTSNFPGEGNQAVAETRHGNDPTASGGDGVSEFPIAISDYPSSWNYAYWGYESITTDWIYQVRSFAPHFWSELPTSSDNIIVTGNWEGRTTPQIPLVFKGGAPSWGAVVLGNHIRFWGFAPRESVVARIPKGRVAFRMVIELKDASPDAYASVHFKKQLPHQDREPTADELWNAPGYTLSINRLGHLELWASDQQTPVYTTNSPDLAWIRDWIHAQMGFNGVHVEVRTHNWSNDIIEIWLKDTYVAGSLPFHLTTVQRSSSINSGENFGVSAYATSGEVRFNERVVADLNVETIVTYSGGQDGGLVTDIVWQSATSDPIELVSATHQLFANLGWANSVWSDEIGNATGSVPVDLTKDQRFLIGDENLGEYLELRVLNAQIDGVDSPAPYVHQSYNPQGSADILPHVILHVNALPEAMWMGHVPAIPAHSIRLTTQLKFVQE